MDISSSLLNFVNSLSAKYTKRNYTHSFSKYYLSRTENQRLSLDEILQKNVKIIETEIIETISYMKETLGLYFSTINTFTASVFHFFEINDRIANCQSHPFDFFFAIIFF
jgi:hypothetical protein